MHWACALGHAHIVRRLLQALIQAYPQKLYGVSIAETLLSEDRFKRIPLHFAARNGHIDCIKLLISVPREHVKYQITKLIKEQLDHMDKDGKTPLLAACENGKLEAAHCLLSCGASWKGQDKQRDLALLYAGVHLSS